MLTICVLDKGLNRLHPFVLVSRAHRVSLAMRKDFGTTLTRMAPLGVFEATPSFQVVTDSMKYPT
jgi:hypothetical protein